MIQKPANEIAFADSIILRDGKSIVQVVDTTPVPETDNVFYIEICWSYRNSLHCSPYVPSEQIIVVQPGDDLSTYRDFRQ